MYRILCLCIVLVMFTGVFVYSAPVDLTDDDWNGLFSSIVDIKKDQIQFGIKGPYEIRRNPDIANPPQNMMEANPPTVTGTDRFNLSGAPISKTFDPEDKNFENLDEWEKTANVDWECFIEPAPFFHSTYDATTETKITDPAIYFGYVYDGGLSPEAVSSLPEKAMLLSTLTSEKYIYKIDGAFYTYSDVKYTWEFCRYKCNWDQQGFLTYTPGEETPIVVEYPDYNPLEVKKVNYIHDQPWDPGIADLKLTDLQTHMGKVQRIYCTLSYKVKKYSSITKKSNGYEPGTLVSEKQETLENFNPYDYATCPPMDPNDPVQIRGIGKLYGSSAKTAVAIAYVEDYLPPSNNPNTTLPNSGNTAGKSYEDKLVASREFIDNASSGRGMFGSETLKVSNGNPTGAINVTVSDQGATAAKATFNYEVGNNDIYLLADPNSNPPYDPANDIPIALLFADDLMNGNFITGDISSYVDKDAPDQFARAVRYPTKRLLLDQARYNKVKAKLSNPNTEGYITLKPADADLKDQRLCSIGHPLEGAGGQTAVFGGGEFAIQLDDVIIPRHFTVDSKDWVNEDRAVPPAQASGHDMDDGYFKVNAADCCNNDTVIMAGKMNYSDDLRPNIELLVYDPNHQDGANDQYRTVPNDHRAVPFCDKVGSATPSTGPAGYYSKFLGPLNPIGEDQFTDQVIQDGAPQPGKYGIWVNNEEVWKTGENYPTNTARGYTSDFLNNLTYPQMTRVIFKVGAFDNIDGEILLPNQSADGKEYRGIRKLRVKIVDENGNVSDDFKEGKSNAAVVVLGDGAEEVDGERMALHADADVQKDKLPNGWYTSYSKTLQFRRPGTYYAEIDAWDGNKNPNNLTVNADVNPDTNAEFGNHRRLRVKIVIEDLKSNY